MIDRQQLLSNLQSVLKRLEADLLERSHFSDIPEVGETLRAVYESAKKAERTAQNYEDWRTDYITQIAAAWVLSCVFVRFLEDNRLIDPPKIAGPNDRLQRARDEHELYFSAHPKETDREYLLAVFDQFAVLPGTRDVFGPQNPLRELPNWLSGDAAGELLRFFQKIDANTGALVHDFTDVEWDTRFLGDLYQDLSEAARKKYALLQTPEFVEEFILDRTLEPALDEFGLEQELAPAAQKSLPGMGDRSKLRSPFKMIDPACGSGHFLLGSFRRILDRWQRREPGANVRDLVQRTLDSVHGVDVNPFAIAIARFRLLLAAMRACSIERLDKGVPDFKVNLVCGDSLLHAPLAAGGKKYTAGQKELDFALASDPEDSDECNHAYRSENLPELKRVLRGGQYHSVVANPPYITPKDPQLNERYRRRYRSCYRQYSLGVPFMERIFRLAVAGGYTGQITTNSFMKREFGKKLIEEFFPTIDLTHVIDTSGAYIPGHGTPTVILFGMNRTPMASTVRTVMGIQSEPKNPTDPRKGLVWSAIVDQVDVPGSESKYASSTNTKRKLLEKHPWAIGGGGAGPLYEQLNLASSVRLSDVVGEMGRTTVLGEDEIWIFDAASVRRLRIANWTLELGVGEYYRDWISSELPSAIYPYESLGGKAISPGSYVVSRYLWFYRARLNGRTVFGKTLADMNRPWFEHLEHYRAKLDGNPGIAFANVTTSNHFVYERGHRIFNSHTPIIKVIDLESGWLGKILCAFNSSIACFWIHQVCHNKGRPGAESSGADEKWEQRYEIDSTKLKQFPLVYSEGVDWSSKMLALIASVERSTPARIVTNFSAAKDIRREVLDSERRWTDARSQMIAYQEELDWECYRLYGLIATPTERQGASPRSQADEEPAASALRLTTIQPPPLQLGQRAFEIVLARKMAAGETQTTWFERHGSTPITELPAEWPEDYRQLIERRIALITSDPNIRLIEQPEYKRRWNTEPWDTQLERALREWLLDRLESYFDFDGRMKDLSQRREGVKEEDEPHTLCASA